jgi:hypothetical protein
VSTAYRRRITKLTDPDALFNGSSPAWATSTSEIGEPQVCLSDYRSLPDTS